MSDRRPGNLVTRCWSRSTWLPLLLAVACSSEPATNDPRLLLRRLEQACERRDTGAILLEVDPGYLDGLGGRGRLEDDLRQMFSVYGNLELRYQDVRQAGQSLECHLQLRGRRLEYSGPQFLTLVQGPRGWQITSGLLEIPRAIIDSLRERRLGLEEGDPGRLRRVIAENYRGLGGDRRHLLERLEQDLAQGPQRALVVDKLHIRAEREQATVIQDYLLILGLGEQAQKLRGREKLHMLYQAGRWRIAGGLG